MAPSESGGLAVSSLLLTPTTTTTTTDETASYMKSSIAPQSMVLQNDENSTIPAKERKNRVKVELTLPKCELPPATVYEPVQDVVAAAVESQHLQPKDAPLVDAYRGLIDVLRSKKDLEMMQCILIALRTSGKGKTLTYLTQSAAKHTHLIHFIVRLNPYELNVEDKVVADYAIADAQLNLLMAIVSSNSVFLVPTMTSLWKFLTVKLEDAPIERTSRLHAALATLLRLVPKAKTEFFPIIHANAPFRTRPAGEIIWYYTQALKALQYAPSMEPPLLELAVDRSLEMDVEIKITDAGQALIDRENDKEENVDVSGIFELDMDSTPASKGKKEKLDASVTVDEMADKLDAMMGLLLQHISQSSDLASIFNTLLDVFDNSILITHKAKFVQFLLLYTCGLGRDESVPIQNQGFEDRDFLDRVFVRRLIQVLYNPMKSVVTRQTGACYLASFVSRANFCRPDTVCEAVHALLLWAEVYVKKITEISAPDARQQSTFHSLFYTVAQAAFYIMCFRGKEAWEFFLEQTEPDELTDINASRWEHLCAHKLNPLRHCLESVRVEFLQLAQVYKLIPDNLRQSILDERKAVPKRKRRSTLSTPATLEKERLKGGVGGLGQGSNPLDSFFPFDPYLLRQSHVYIEPLYRHWQGSAVANLPTDDDEIEDQEISESADEGDDDRDASTKDDHDIDNDEDVDSVGDDTSSYQPMSFTSKLNGFDESPAVRVELGGEFAETMGRPRALSIENGSW